MVAIALDPAMYHPELSVADDAAIAEVEQACRETKVQLLTIANKLKV
jgi:hypothetical protein